MPESFDRFHNEVADSREGQFCPSYTRGESGLSAQRWSRAALALPLIACACLSPAVAQTTTQTGSQAGSTSDLAQQELARFEKLVTVKVLPNGLTVLLIERPEAPVFSYYTLVDAGDANDPTGQSGLAHMFEHLAFKGTDDDRHNQLAG